MTSKEVLEYLKTCNFCKIVMGTDYENDDRYFTIYDIFNEEIEIIEKDLERLEKLEKENQELKEKCKMLEENEEAVLATLEISVQENTRLKKVIEIFRKMCSLNNNKTLETEECFLRLTKEEYELLKEVLKNE